MSRDRGRLNGAELIGLRNTPKGSSEVIFASSIADFTMRSRPWRGNRSSRCWRRVASEDANADRFGSGFFERLDLSEANDGENSLPSRTTHSAAVAPPALRGGLRPARVL